MYVLLFSKVDLFFNVIKHVKILIPCIFNLYFFYQKVYIKWQCFSFILKSFTTLLS